MVRAKVVVTPLPVWVGVVARVLCIYDSATLSQIGGMLRDTFLVWRQLKVNETV